MIVKNAEVYRKNELFGKLNSEQRRYIELFLQHETLNGVEYQFVTPITIKIIITQTMPLEELETFATMKMDQLCERVKKMVETGVVG